MKKLVFIIPLMAISLLASCSGGDKPEQVEFMLSSEQETMVVDKTATVYVDWNLIDHIIKFNSFTFTADSGQVNTTSFDQTTDPRPMPVKIIFNEKIIEDISGTLSFTYEDITAKKKDSSSIDITIPKIVIPDSLLFTSDVDNWQFNITTGKPETYASLEYSFDNINWNKVDFKEAKIAFELKVPGKKLYLRGDNPNGLSNENNSYAFHFVMPDTFASIYISGNIMSLLFKDGGDINTIPNAYCFSHLFANNEARADAAQLTLPAKSLKENCYEYLFSNFEFLSSAPKLPCKSLEKECYKCMFYGCTMMNFPPSLLPAEALPESCYEGMFYECKYMEIAPTISCKTMSSNSCKNMFNNCNCLKIFELEHVEARTFFTCPIEFPDGAVTDMFAGTSGDFIGTPNAGKSYLFWRPLSASN